MHIYIYLSLFNWILTNYSHRFKTTTYDFYTSFGIYIALIFFLVIKARFFSL